MKYTTLPALFFLLLLIASCIFTQPLFMPQDIYTDARLPGTWYGYNAWSGSKAGGEIDTVNPYNIRRVDSVHYYVSHKQGSSLYMDNYLTLVRLKGHLFADIQLVNVNNHKPEEGHILAKASLGGDSLSIVLLDMDYLEKEVKAGRMHLQYYMTKGSNMSDGMGSPPTMIFTESTLHLQNLVLDLYDNKQAFNQVILLLKKKKI